MTESIEQKGFKGIIIIKYPRGNPDALQAKTNFIRTAGLDGRFTPKVLDEELVGAAIVEQSQTRVDRYIGYAVFTAEQEAGVAISVRKDAQIIPDDPVLTTPSDFYGVMAAVK